MTIFEMESWIYENKYIFLPMLLFFFILLILISYKREHSSIGKPSIFWDAKRAGLRLARPSKVHGIMLGKIGNLRLFSPEESEEHVIVTGATGDGKTSPFAIPSLLSWRGSLWAMDISGDISAVVDRPDKLIFAPLSTDSILYNVFAPVDKLNDPIERDEKILNIVLKLVPRSATDSTAKFFEDGGRDIVEAAFLAYYHQGLDFSEICYKIVSLDYPDLFAEIDSIGYKDASIRLNKFDDPDRKKDTAGCKQSATDAVKFFCSPRLSTLLRRPTKNEIAMDPESCEKYSCFLTIPDTFLEQYSPLVELIVSQLLEYLSGRPVGRKKILVLIDEYGSFKNLDVSDALQKYRKRGVRLMLLLQSLMRLDENFGSNYRKELISNCKINVISGEAEPGMQEYFSLKCGTKFERKITKNEEGKILSVTEEEKRIFQPYELARLSSRKQSVIIANGYAFKLRQARFYEEKSFKNNKQ